MRAANMLRRLPRAAALVLVALAAAISASADPESELAAGSAAPIPVQEAVPLGRLPADVVPTHYWLALEIVPERDKFRGTVDISVELGSRRDVIWMHGRGLEVSEATVQVLAEDGSLADGPADAEQRVSSVLTARWEQVHEQGVVALRLPEAVGPGHVRLRIVYEAPFNRQITGLYRVDTGGASYAFTDFEPSDARLMIPSFDEPSAKAPFDLTLDVPKDQVAVANTRVLSEELLASGLKRVRFAATERLSTYLLAFAVGPLDIVEGKPFPPNSVRAHPLPFRCIAARGYGTQLRYAVENTEPILAKLEEYFGTAYPFDKLDFIAVPDYAAGAMENPGLITFRQERLVFEGTGLAESQKRRFAGIVAHELAHMWFGDLVTMSWWDDLWLNEGFASWMGDHIVQELYPGFRMEIARIESAQRAMQIDSLDSARQVRQPIESHHDVLNAFDGITYSKGSALLGMFERWLGGEGFRKGIRLYMQKHHLGNATSDEFLAALSQGAGKETGDAFRSFLLQPGVPLVEARLVCEAGAAPYLALRQSRSLPAGSAASKDRIWQIPVCARHGAGETLRESCTLLSAAEGRLELESKACPDWVMPNAAGKGYYRWSLPREDREKLRLAGWRHLTEAERASYAESLATGFSSATLPAAEVFEALRPLAAEPGRSVATAPMRLLETARESLVGPELRPSVEAYARGLYLPVLQRLGWEERPGEDGETKLLRQRVVEFLIETGRAPEAAAEAARRGRAYLGHGGDGALHPEALPPDLVDIALVAAVQAGDAAFFDAVLGKIGTNDATLRVRLIKALGRAIAPGLAERARALSLDPRLRVNEVMLPLEAQAAELETREQSWSWLKANFDSVVGRLGTQLQKNVLRGAQGLCTTAHAEDVQSFLGPAIGKLAGGPRTLANTVESIRLCAARAEAQGPSARSFFQKPAAGSETGSVPEGRLPAGVRPARYKLELEAVPDRERFSGSVSIEVELQEQQSRIWMHGLDLEVTESIVLLPGSRVVQAQWKQVSDVGVAALTLAEPIGPGPATIRITYSAPFNRQLEGFYRVEAGGRKYLFTDLQPTSARRVLPCFDEPAFKAVFEVVLTVPQDQTAVSNGPVAAEESLPEGLKRLSFAATEKLPTYLLLLAVGPFDVVEASLPPNAVRSAALPFRGIAVQGRGPEMAYAMANTGPLLDELEDYFGTPYPFAKLDILAVPDFAWGGMENAAAITFNDPLLLFDEKTAPESQLRSFTIIMAHELAHMWFGDTVTMPWWDDIWLNESFAEWMGIRVVAKLHPRHRAEAEALGAVHSAMRTDSLQSARQVRQPIESHHDIDSAFDSITYQKGGGLLTMLERWLGEESFRKGIRLYMSRHRFASATADDLLAALSEAAGKDVATPLRTFLFQPGVPLLQAATVCTQGTPYLELSQSRSLPVGSGGDRDKLWQIPVCVRYAAGGVVRESCTLLAESKGRLDLEGGVCPDWVLPNAAGAGYYRWSLPPADLERLRTRGWASLTSLERLSLASNLHAAFNAATLPAAEVFAALAPFAEDPDREVAKSPMDIVGPAREQLVSAELRPRVEAFARRLYRPLHEKLGWDPVPGEAGDAKLLREDVISFLAGVALDPQVRAEAARRGRLYAGAGGDGKVHPEAVAPELARTCLAVAVQEGDAAFFDLLLGHLTATEESELRGRILAALGAARQPELAARARALALDQRLKVKEVLRTLYPQMFQAETRAEAWGWLKQNFDGVLGRLNRFMAGELPWLASGFCDAESAKDVQAFLKPRVEAIDGAPRNLAGALESIALCVARVEAQRESARSFFERQAP